MTILDAWRRVTAYFASPDPRLAIGNTVAFIVVGNQPFYPFYVWYAAGAMVPAAFLVWLSTPLFLAAPPCGRRAPGWSRVLLLAASIGNTALSTKALGPASGVELFYIPCLLVAWAIFLPSRRLAGVAAAAGAIVVGLAFGRLTGPPLADLSPIQSHALRTMDAISVACLTAVIAFQSWRVERALSRSDS